MLTLPFDATERKPHQADASLRLMLWGPLPFARGLPCYQLAPRGGGDRFDIKHYIQFVC